MADSERYNNVVAFFPNQAIQDPDDLAPIDDIASLGFPTWVMGGFAGRMAWEYARIMEAPMHFFYMSALTCMGHMFGDRVRDDTSLRNEPRLFTILLGEAGDARKSTAINFTTEFFTKVAEASWPRRSIHLCHGVGSAEGLQAELNSQPSTLLCLDEFSHFATKAGIDSSVLLQCVNSLFESHNYSNRLKNQDFKVKNARLSMLAASTTDTFEECMGKAFTNIGFDTRLFLVVGKSQPRYSRPPKMRDDVKEELIRQAVEIFDRVHDGLELPTDPNAYQHFDTWYLNRKHGEGSKRLDAYAARLMLLIAVNDGKQSIDIETVHKAIALCDWQLVVRRRYAVVNANNPLARIEMGIVRQLGVKGGMTRRELWLWTNARRDGVYTFEKAISNLVNARMIYLDARDRYFLSKNQ